MKRFATYVVISALLLIPLLLPTPPVYSNRATKPDSYGYFWVDSKQPSPTVSYQWLNVRSQGSTISFSSPSTPAHISLPFSIPFYSRTYNNIYVSVYGHLSFLPASYSYPVRIPSTSSPNAVVAVYSSYDYAYSNGGVYYLIGTEGQKRFVAVEWLTNYDQNFEVIIYETGFIKMQYRDVDATYSAYSNGARSYCGIEDHSGTVATVYCANSGNIQNGLAVVYTLYKTQINSVELKDGDGSSGNYLLAKYKTYHLDVSVSDDGGFSDISTVKVKLGNFTSAPVITYENKNKTFSLSDPKGYLSLVESECRVTSHGDLDGTLTMAFMVNFTYPQNGYINLSVEVTALTALESRVSLLTTLYIISRVVVTGVPTFTGEFQGKISDGDFIRGGEVVTMRGVALYYQMTLFTPPNEVFSVYLTDGMGGVWWDNSSSGRKVYITTRAPQEDLVWHLTFGVVGIPESALVMEPIEITLKVDSTPPPSPYHVKVHADSYNDTATEYDNDRDIFITWDADEEEGSGLSYFVIVVKKDDEYVNITVPDAEARRYKLKDAPQGRFQVGIKAVDRVGNQGDVVFTNFTVDLSPVEFKLLEPQNENWVKTLSPLIKVELTDPDTEVDGPSAEYALSTDGGVTWSSWKNAGAYEKAPSVVVELQPTLKEGRKNMIKFRARDVAGNPLNESIPYHIWVDTVGPKFFDFYPGDKWVTSENVQIRIKITDSPGSGVNPATVMYRYSRGGADSYTSWMPIQGVMDSFGILTITTTLRLSPTGQNLIQFKASDMLGHLGVSPEYVIKVDNPPETEIVSPQPGETYLTNESIPLNCTLTDRDGNPDKLYVQWLVDGVEVATTQNTTLSEGLLSPGVHTIVLKVHDSIPSSTHNITKWVRIIVKEAPPQDPFQRDSDQDGIPDGYEEKWGTDPYKKDSDMDLDGDGYSNLEEYLAGTDPTRKSSSPSSGLIETTPTVMLIAVMFLVIAGMAFLNIYMKKRWREKLITLQSATLTQAAAPPPTETTSGSLEGTSALPPSEEEGYPAAESPDETLAQVGEGAGEIPIETVPPSGMESGGFPAPGPEEVAVPPEAEYAPESEGTGGVTGEGGGEGGTAPETDIPQPPPPPPPPPEVIDG